MKFATYKHFYKDGRKDFELTTLDDLNKRGFSDEEIKHRCGGTMKSFVIHYDFGILGVNIHGTKESAQKEINALKENYPDIEEITTDEFWEDVRQYNASKVVA